MHFENLLNCHLRRSFSYGWVDPENGESVAVSVDLSDSVGATGHGLSVLLQSDFGASRSAVGSDERQRDGSEPTESSSPHHVGLGAFE